MASVRVKLTLTYSLALAGSLAAFGGTLYVARQVRAKRDLAVEAASRADMVVRILQQTERDQLVILGDSITAPILVDSRRRVLEAVPDYLIVTDSAGYRLFTSDAVRRLPPADALALNDAIPALGSPGEGIIVTLANDRVLLVQRRVPTPGVAARVIAGVSVSATDTAQQELLGSMLVVAPLILGVSIAGAYFIAGRAFRPVDQLINEVEAITDGRSLHRRLAVEPTGDEIARLGTTLNDMIARLETSFGGLRRFTADASHELKTPLTVLRADVERAMGAGSGTNEQLVALEEALAEITRMADLVDSLLTLARADEGRFDIHRDPVDIELLARDVFETALILGEDAGLTVTMPQVEPATVMGDRLRLRQLFLNLVTNAIKYTPRGGSVEMTLNRRDGQVFLAVKDTGIGIAAADLPYIFERFWRADRARSRASGRGGFGLGLAISQWIAQAHGGSLAVQSRLGRGSTFTLALPVAEPPEAAELPSESPAEGAATA